MQIVVLPPSQRPRSHPGETIPDRLKRQVLEAMYDQKPNGARNLIYKARKRVAKEPDAPWAAELARQCDFAEQRLRAEKKKAKQAQQERVARRAKQKAQDTQRAKALAKPVSCTHCLRPFTRKKSQQRLCPSCRPSERRSVRTVSGGLPTLGRRR